MTGTASSGQRNWFQKFLKKNRTSNSRPESNISSRDISHYIQEHEAIIDPDCILSIEPEHCPEISNDAVHDYEESPEPEVQSDVLSNCRCCGTILKYPTFVKRIKCTICDTITIVENGDPKNADRNGLDNDSSQTQLLSLEYLEEFIQNNPSPKALGVMLYESFSSFKILNSSFRVPNYRLSHRTPGLDFPQIKLFYKRILKLPSINSYYKMLLGMSDLLKRSPELEEPQNILWLLIILELPTFQHVLIHKANIPELRSVQYDILKRTIGLIANLNKTPLQYLCNWLHRSPEFLIKVDLINLYITFHVTKCINYQLKPTNTTDTATHSEDENVNYKDTLFKDMNVSSPTQALDALPQHAAMNRQEEFTSKIGLSQYGNNWHIRTGARALSIFFTANSHHGKFKVPVSNFYNTLVDYVNIKEDFDAWQLNNRKMSNGVSSTGDSVQSVIDYLQNNTISAYYGILSNDPTQMRKLSFTFCQFPFLISLGSKISILEHEAKRKMERKAEEAFINSLNQKQPFGIYFKVRVRRGLIANDSLKCIKNHTNDLQKSLKVEFVDEPGVDAGGLKKEWFVLLTRELFHPNKGLFSYDETSKLAWFTISNIDHEELYYLVGVVLGLAIYNSTILDLRLPFVLFKKLLNKKPSLEDFCELYPENGGSLRKLLKLQDDEIWDNMEIYFEVTYSDLLGTIKTDELVPGGSSIKVNNSNKNEYISRYLDFYLNKIISNSFNSFYKGFYSVIGGNALSLFSPHEIQLIVLGDDNDGKKVDTEILKSVTNYNGWDSREAAITSKQVSWFWEFFDSISYKQQKKLLLFITGSDRIPATGIQNLPFKITRLKGNKNRFPIAHTCFNELCLYEYPDKNTMWRKLEYGMNESEGFGIK
ncbi:BA75_02707T0 [Komagataella pastoris]|uniref:HECT-type E3 ubiquitin transferase n=1 Tax=Komagataella pastoris TaxID=4922 RepID=A0A1B2JCJ0_PICPA|nr:BA75_02707T0 [Komagataella pastoris]